MGGKTDVVKGRIKKAAGALMHTDYLSPTIRQLRDQQVRFAPYEKQITKQIAQETGRSEKTVRSTLSTSTWRILTWRSSRTMTAPCGPNRL